MITKTIDLYQYYGIKRPENAAGYLTTYVLDPIYEGRKRPAMLVIAGGGYSMVSNREAEPIAMAYMVKGFNAFTLDYSVKPVTFPAQLIEACMAMAYVRENAEELMVDKEHVSAIGFSAGGHLCGMLATMPFEKEVKDVLKEKTMLCRPDAVILSYPVACSFNKPHQNSIDNLSGKDIEIQKRISIEARVDSESSPAFIWTTVSDGCVPSENSLEVAYAYKKNGVPFELHMFEKGSHGLSVATKETGYVNVPVQEWVGLSITWLRERGFDIIDK